MPWEETDTQIRHQLLDPDGFQDKSFRTIPIKKDKPRIWGIIGKLKGKTTTTLQALRFPKEDGWTMAKAKEWVKGHGDRLKEAVMFEDKATKDFLFEVKEVTEAGEFTGILSVYDVIDLGGDLVEPGPSSRRSRKAVGLYLVCGSTAIQSDCSKSMIPARPWKSRANWLWRLLKRARPMLL